MLKSDVNFDNQINVSAEFQSNPMIYPYSVIKYKCDIDNDNDCSGFNEIFSDNVGSLSSECVDRPYLVEKQNVSSSDYSQCGNSKKLCKKVPIKKKSWWSGMFKR
tara:strand:- start:27 stop:341 length:315 start_codon:yes stop_codon:yes gene_type:complete